MRTLLAIFLFAGMLIEIPAQDFQWAGNYGSDSTLSAVYEIQTGPNGNVYSVGECPQGTFDMNPENQATNYTVIGQTDGYIQELNPRGELVSVRMIESQNAQSYSYITDLDIDKSGNIYVIGGFNGQVDFNVKAGNLFKTGTGDLFVAKYDSSFNVKWVFVLPGLGDAPGYSNKPNASQLAIDSLGSVYIGGAFTGTVDFNPGSAVLSRTSIGQEDIFILKINSSGSFTWAATIGGIGTDNLHDIKIDRSGDLMATGQFSDSVDFDPGPGVHKLGFSYSGFLYLLKLNSNGGFVWAAKGAGREGKAIAFDKGDAIYVANLDRGAIEKFSPSGILQWTKGRSNNTTALDLDFSATHGLFVTGKIEISRNESIYIRKLDTAGNFLKTEIIGNGSSHWGESIHCDNIGNVYSTGFFIGSTDFDPSDDVKQLNSSKGAIFVRRHASCPVIKDTLYDTICRGENYKFPDGTIAYNIQGHTAQISNFFVENYCDSSITTFLYVKPLDLVINVGIAMTVAESGAQYQWVDCQTLQAIPGANSQNYRPPYNGSYAVIVSKNGCSDTSECISFATGIITSKNLSDILVYPNPSIDFLQIDTDLSLEQISIYSVDGKLQLSDRISNDKRIDVSALELGVYFLKVEGDWGVEVLRFQKN